jgi:TolB-like protein
MERYADIRNGLSNGVVMGKSHGAKEPRKEDIISDDAVRDELSRILESLLFVQSDRLGRFLRFTVETTLEGKAGTLKEYLIGTAVYDRRSDYHPGEDSIVRSEARRLRRKLQEYYESAGKSDPVFIYFRPGSYVPAFRRRDGHNGDITVSDAAQDDLFPEGRGVRVAVLPFVDVSRSHLSGACAQFITDELIHELVRTDGLRVTSACSVVPLVAQAFDIPSLAQKLDVQIIFEGTVREENSQLRITSRVVNADGFQIWSERFETERDPQRLFTVSERIASALISRIRPEQSLIRQQKASVGASMLAVYPLVLRAEALLDGGTLTDAQSALSKFQEVAEIEPRYARPLCGIAVCYCEMALRGIPNSSSAIGHAREAAERAAKLDPQMTLAPACMGSVLALEWNWRDAEKSFQQAIGLGEHAGTYRHYALLLASLGRFDEAWNYIQKAQQIDPFSYRQKVVYTKLFHLSRNYEQGLEHISEQLMYGPLPIESELYQALMLASLDRRDEARQLTQGLPRKAGAQPVMMSGVAEVLAMCGQSTVASRIAADYSLFSPNSPISKFRQALLSLALAKPSEAISLLCAAHEDREPELIWLGSDPRLDLVREDPRFVVLLTDVLFKSTDGTAVDQP